MNPIEGDLNGYCSGRWTFTFQTPPSYGVPLGPKNLTTNSSNPLRMVTSCLLSISLMTSVSIRRFPALGDDILSLKVFSCRKLVGGLSLPRKKCFKTRRKIHKNFLSKFISTWSFLSVETLLPFLLCASVTRRLTRVILPDVCHEKYQILGNNQNI